MFTNEDPRVVPALSVLCVAELEHMRLPTVRDQNQIAQSLCFFLIEGLQAGLLEASIFLKGHDTKASSYLS